MVLRKSGEIPVNSCLAGLPEPHIKSLSKDVMSAANRIG
ncbi:hypothetical protein Desti_1509 [Desulfomonile tiedjei DSM 6799]|uniref:Uncharacterized protein n=1 Tax=Desulfomonile tiedjei (strain ATCC 49306 / DSM 6799 / DCB-1) TaxID=706587 RepID=I4C3T0_DESTA|nr:hypothetical protein Desti_1509 [Desulfomonile tiedjei DSM 6799]